MRILYLKNAVKVNYEGGSGLRIFFIMLRAKKFKSGRMQGHLGVSAAGVVGPVLDLKKSA